MHLDEFITQKGVSLGGWPHETATRLVKVRGEK